jgi:emfourin
MRIAIVRGGGVAGLTSRTRLDSETLPPPDAEALQERVRSSGLLSPAERPARPPRHPDELAYAVKVEEGGTERTHRFGEDDLPEEVRSLLEWIDARPECEHEVGPPG